MTAPAGGTERAGGRMGRGASGPVGKKGRRLIFFLNPPVVQQVILHDYITRYGSPLSQHARCSLCWASSRHTSPMNQRAQARA